MYLIIMISVTLLISSVLGSLVKSGGLKNTSIDPIEITFGFMLLVIGLSILSLLLPASTDVTGYIVAMGVSVCTLVLIFSIKHSGRHRVLQTIFCSINLGILFLVLIYSCIGANEIRYHTNPDIYGVAAAVGYFNHNFSLSHLKEAYINMTGLPTATWVPIPPNFESIWNIPDQQLRFTSDLIIGSGRMGLSLLGAVWVSIIDPIRFYPSFLMGLGILAIWSIAVTSLELVREIATFLKKTARPQYGIISIMVASTFLLCIALSPWAAISVLEGAVAQAWFTVACLAQMLVFLRATTVPRSTPFHLWKTMVCFSIAPLFTYFIYPFGAPLLLICTFPFGLLLAWEKGVGEKNVALVLASIPGSLLLIIIYCIDSNLLTTTGQAGAMFLNGAVGGGYHIGMPTPLDLMTFSNKALVFIKDGFGRTHSELKHSLVAIYAYGVIATFILLISLWKLSISEKCKALLLILPSCILFLFCAGTIHVIIHHPEGFNDYVFARHLTTLVILSMPVIMGFIISSEPFLKLSSLLIQHKTYIAGLCLLVMLRTTIGFFAMTDPYFSVTRKFSPVESCQSLAKTKDEIYVSKNQEQTITAIALCRPLFYLTDGWEPSFKAQTGSRMVFSLSPESKMSGPHFVGTIVITKNIKGPMTLDDLKKSSNVQWTS